MFEREINFIYDFNANKVRKVGTHISFEQLKTCGIHPAVLQYVLAEIDFLIFEDRQKLINQSIFDYNSPNVLNYFRVIAEELKRDKKFSVTYIDKIIQHAASFIVNYISKPNWTLLRFVFDDGNEKTLPEIEQILSYTFYYPHLKKIIISYLKKKKIITINSTGFEELLYKIDSIGLETNYNKIIDEALDSMADFFNIGVSKTTHIPVKAVEYFLLDKNLHVHHKHLEKNYNLDALQKVNVVEMKEFLKRILIEKPEYLEDDLQESNPVIEQIKIVEHEESVVSDTPQKENTSTSQEPNEIPVNENETQNESKEFSEEENNNDYKIGGEVTTDKNDDEQLDLMNDEVFENLDKTNVDDEDLLSMESDEESISEIDSSDSLENDETEKKEDISEVHENNELTEILHDESMTKVLDAVFDYDVEEFSNAIEKIIRTNSIDEAYSLIDKYCENAKLKPDSKESKTFKNVISKYFK